jgi:DNA polymerase-1
MHYDLHFLLPLLGFPREPLFDTRYAHSLIHPDARHDLGFLTSVYTNMNYHKDDVSDWKSKHLPKDDTLWTYNIKDVITTHRIYQGLKKDLRELNMYDFFTGYITPFRRVIFEMESRGLRVDLPLRDEWKTFIEEEELPIALDILKNITGQDINPNSSKQIGDYLYSQGVSLRKTPKGNYSLGEEDIKDLIAKYPQHRQFLKQVLCTRVLKSKDLGTYLSAKLSSDNRMKSSYSYTVTGRLTSSKNHQSVGSNLQNIPKNLRQIFLPEEGHVFLDPDLKAAEAMCKAYEMKSDKM